MDKKTPETTEKLEDLQQPETPKRDDVAATDGESVKGGRKAGETQHEYIKITMSDVIISS